MTEYTLNFDKIREDTFTESEAFNGIYWNDISPTHRAYKHIIYYVMRMRTFGYPPILCIDESVQEHFTQILFILKESYSNKTNGFTGWRPFTKKYLMKVCEEDYNIYRTEWGKEGEEFVKEFPKKIEDFVLLYCDKHL